MADEDYEQDDPKEPTGLLGMSLAFTPSQRNGKLVRLWKEAMKDEAVLEKVRAYKRMLEFNTEAWGRFIMVSDLTLASVNTCKLPGISRYSFYNPKGGKKKEGKWNNVREGKDKYPAWVINLGEGAEDWMYDHQTKEYGKLVPDEAKT